MGIQKFISMFIVLIMCMNSYAQDYEIKGKLVDTADYNFVNTATVTIIRQSDSLMQGKTRADDNGIFSVKIKESGTYLLMVAHPTFATYIDKIEVKEIITDLGEISLSSKKTLLEGVIISAESAIMIKGDTTIYAADSFNVREFASVDELLKKLPGLEVNKDGSITAHGEKVQKMYVDGEEFFSDDPAVLAQTLRASTIDKVQVYNDKSETAKNTGVDDGERVKTINLTLKEDAKKGYYGKLSLGGALPDFYEGQAMIQAYKAKQKLSAYAIGSNTNKQMSWDDRYAYAEGTFEYEINDDGNSTVTYYGDNTNGLPKSIIGGVSYSNKWLEDKINLNGNYGFKQIDLNTATNGTTKYILPDTQYITTSNSNTNAKTLSNSINVKSDIKFDTTSNLNIRVSGKMEKIENYANTSTQTANLEGAAINSSESTNSNITDKENANINLTYRKRFKKAGRSMSLGFDAAYKHAKSNGSLRSNNNVIATNTDVDYNQIKENETNGNSYGLRLTYTEPIIKNVFLEANYNFTNTNNTANLQTFDVSNGQKIYDSLFSNNYTFDYYINKGGLNLRYNNKKIRASIGSDIADAQFNQKNNLHTANSRKYSYLNIFPRAAAYYMFNTYSSININYNGSTKQPTIGQLQPLIINTDPTNIMVGNENLRQQFTHNLSVFYHTYSVLKGQSIYLSISGSLIDKPIVQAQTIDETGFRVYTFVNSKNAQSVSGYGSYSKKIGDFRLGFSANGSYNRSYNFSNSLENINDYYRINPGVSIYYEVDTTLEISYRFSPAYNNSQTSLRKDINNEFWQYNQAFEVAYLMSYGIRLATGVNWNIRPQTNENIKGNNVCLWNVSVSKSLLKDRSLIAKIYCYDLLNQNKGYNNYQMGDVTSESFYNVIKQYFMLSLTWNFTKIGGGSNNSTSED